MNLTEEKQRIAVEWVRDRCQDMKCSACGSGAFQVAGLVATPNAPIQIGGNCIAFVAFSCKDCGNTYFFQESAVFGFEP